MILVDTHTHVHAVFDVEKFLDAALLHMTAHAHANEQLDMALCLTETRDQHFFKDLTSRMGETVAGPWQACHAPDSVSIRLDRASGHSLWLVAGRQIATSERLEILCLGHDADIPDHIHSLTELTPMILQLGGLPVLPWGFGKWTRGRGRAVKAFLEQGSVPDNICLGDNSNRPRLWPEPEAFAIARKKNIAILPGSDPLPLAFTCADVGRYGLRMDGSLPAAAPWAHLRSRLANPDLSCVPYGKRESLPRFVWNQTRLRLPH